jgi:hypothetical protein
MVRIVNLVTEEPIVQSVRESIESIKDSTLGALGYSHADEL